jgi:hypothetical protein
MRQLNNAKESTYLIEVQKNAKESKKASLIKIPGTKSIS